jgi:hypothetical protein
MEINPTIVISAYRRPHTLQRLLNSIASAYYENTPINLVISIDKSFDLEVKKVAEKFDWLFGKKRIICHQTHLGLKQHILFCGALTKEYYSIILLEDDLVVSPYFYEYANQASIYYINDKSIAGISLYNYQVAESCFFRYKAVDDGCDVYFMQVPSSWGLLLTKQQWEAFEEWFALNPNINNKIIPSYVKNWGPNSWKKHYINYLIVSSKYFVFPRLSLSTNFEEPGTNSTQENIFQVALQLTKKTYHFRDLNQSWAVYDASFELLPKCFNLFQPLLSEYNYEVDLYGTKQIAENDFDYVLSSKEGQNPVISFNDSLIPIEANVILNLPGNRIGLYKKSENKFSKSKLTLYNYLDAYNSEKRNSISIIIPIDEINLSNLKATIDSVLNQQSGILECILVSNLCNNESLSKFILKTGKDVRLIIPEIKLALPALLALGFKNATNDILTWIHPGNIYHQNTFSKVQSIFKSYPMLPWICGIEHTHNKDINLKSTELDPYRLDLNDVYKKMLKRELKTDTQLNFFKKHCSASFASNPSSLHDFFFKLTNKYQCFIVVCQFGIGTNYIFPKLSDTDIEEFILQYRHFNAKPKKLITRTLFILMNSALIPKKVKSIFRNQFKGLPDVLRFDENHETFYLSKY